jgi:hypothetical protein
MTPKKYNELNEMLAEYSELSAQLASIEAVVNKKSLDAARTLLPQHSETKARIGDIEAKLRVMAVENPELFTDDKKTHQTPFGSVAFRTSTYLDVDDEEKVVLKIKAACQKELKRASALNVVPRFTEEMLLRKIEQPNLEALEQFDDADLSTFGVVRKTEEKFSVKPLEVKADKLSKKAKTEPVQEAA